MAGRSGARPIPPATTTTSLPRPFPTSHPVPNGPRTPSTVPGPAATSAAVTEPTLRTVCSIRSGRLGSPLIEMGASPTPNACSMVNWPGTVLGVRGPFGTGWDVGKGRGGDVVVVAGGIGLAPLRPAILELIAHRADFDRVVLLYGARTPEDILFTDDLRAWAERDGIIVEVTVDNGQHAWRGRVGLVTQLVTRAGFDAVRALALVCGPEVMMRYAAQALSDRGVRPERLRLSMERNMKCGVGLCGHCQLRELFLCVDGPVLGYDRLAPLMSRAEL